jgi:hypothetical protein
MNIRDLIRQLGGQSSPLLQIGTVKSIDGLKCDVSIEFEEDLLDVNLALGDNLTLVPKIGSMVVVAMMGQFGYVVMVEEADKAILNIAGQKLTIQATGIEVEGFLSLASQTADLKSTLEELLDFIQNLQTTVTTPAGPGSGILNPALIPQLVAIKTKFNTFLK